MKRLVSIVLLAMLCSVAPPAKGNPTGDAPPEPADQCQPPAVVASFLDFTDAQAAQFEDLLTQLQTTVYGLQQQIATLQTQLDEYFYRLNVHTAEKESENPLRPGLSFLCSKR